MPRHRGRRTPGLSAPAATLLRAAAVSVLGMLPGVVGLSCLIGPVAPANAAAPVVPLVIAHHHWDHHWFVWLPRHPVYESVEVMSIDSAGDYFRAVWVFFTERHGGKRQTHFFDSRQIVERFPGSHYRPIEYERSGTPGQGLSVRVALAGLDDVPIEVAVDLADQPLTRIGAGLTDQSGHSAGTLFLLFHRDRVALARTNEVRIGGGDYSFRAGGDPTGKREHGVRGASSLARGARQDCGGAGFRDRSSLASVSGRRRKHPRGGKGAPGADRPLRLLNASFHYGALARRPSGTIVVVQCRKCLSRNCQQIRWNASIRGSKNDGRIGWPA